jgi:type I restriction enzyme S subunit
MDRIKEAKKLRQETKKQTELLWQSVLAETFPQPGTQLPNGWRWVRLGDVARIFSGSPAPQDKRYFEEGSIPFVRVQDLGRYGITTNLTETSDKINGEAVKELRLVKANKGTILFPKSGAAILTNSRAILGEDAYFVSHLAAVEPFYDVLETLWAFYWLCTVDMGRYIDNPAYPSLRLSKIRELLIPLPPFEEQKRIANYLQEVHEKIRELKEVQAKTDEEIKLLEQSILEKAFRGEL